MPEDKLKEDQVEEAKGPPKSHTQEGEEVKNERKTYPRTIKHEPERMQD